MARANDTGDAALTGTSPVVRRVPGAALAAPGQPLEGVESRRAPMGKRQGSFAGLAPIPRIALTRAEAAAALGMSLDSFERHVQPELRLVRRGSMRLVPVAELGRWVADVAEPTL